MRNCAPQLLTVAVDQFGEWRGAVGAINADFDRLDGVYGYARVAARDRPLVLSTTRVCAEAVWLSAWSGTLDPSGGRVGRA